VKQLFQIHPDAESKKQFQQLCLRIDRGDVVVLDEITDKLVKESIQVLFSVLQMKHYTSLKKLIKKTGAQHLEHSGSFQNGYVKSKHTPVLEDLFSGILPSFKDVFLESHKPSLKVEKKSSPTTKEKEERTISLEMDRDEWLKQRTQAPIGRNAMDSALKHLQRNPFEFSEAGTLGSTPGAGTRASDNQAVGPMLPSVPPVHGDNVDEDEAFGPSFAPDADLHSSFQPTSTTSAAQSRKQEWDRIRNKSPQEFSSSDSSSVSKKTEREEWMTALPQLGMRPTLDTITNRKFSKKITEPVREEDRKGWSSAPKQK
jgi:hypothetical protein